MRTIFTLFFVAYTLGLSTPALARRLDVAAREARLHSLARLLAELGRQNIVVSGRVKGSATRVAKGLTFRDALAAFMAGHEVTRLGKLWIVAPDARSSSKRHRKLGRRLGKLPRRARRIDLDFQRADLRNLVRLIGDISGMKLTGTAAVTGEVTLRARDLRWSRALEAMLLAQSLGVDARARGRGKIASLAEHAAGKPLKLSDIKPPPPDPNKPRAWNPLRSKSPVGFRLVAIARRLPRGERLALFEDPSHRGWIMRKGRHIGEQCKVVRVDAHGVTLELRSRDAQGPPTARLVVPLGQRVARDRGGAPDAVGD
jgi:hypothetical protein